MKKTLRIISIICLFAIALSMPVFASNDIAVKKIDVVEPSFDSIEYFIKKGEAPDLTKGSIRFTYEDGSVETVTLTNDLLPTDADYSKTGLWGIEFEVKGEKFSLSFLTYDADRTLAFEDVAKGYWGERAILRCVQAGFLNGMSDTEFATEDNMTRAQFCQMIYNIYKDEKNVMTEGIAKRFNDVPNTEWYYEAVTECSRAGIVNGVAPAQFSPNNPIKRQDVALIMMRIFLGSDALEQINVDELVATARENGIPATDFEETDEYARAAVAASLGVIINGNSLGMLNPKKEIRRVECATIIYNYFLEDLDREQPVPPPEPSGHIVYLSPSNQNSNSYKGVNTTEGIEMKKIAALAKQKLEAMGHTVYISDDKTSIRPPKDGSTFYRATEAKALGADTYVAIHSNAAGGTNNGSIHGTRCFYNGKNEGAMELSQAIFDEMKKITINHDGYIKEDLISLGTTGTPFAEVLHPEMANLILEVEFHDHITYAQWIADNTEAIATAIATGIDNYYTQMDAKKAQATA